MRHHTRHPTPAFAASSGPPGASPADRNGAGVLRREGDYWSISYEGAILRFRDSKGVRYLAHLLQRPGTPIAAAEIIKRIAVEHPTLGYHLRAAVKTGCQCSYEPEPGRRPWEVRL